MNSIFMIVYFRMALSLAVVHGDSETEEKVPLYDELNRIAGKNGTVNDIFKPVKNGFLGEGSCGFVYEGELLKPVRRDIAMKFIPPRNKEFAEQEYTIYSCLEAVDNTDVERYGIPSVYYYGSYKNYTMIGITLLDFGFHETFQSFQFNIIDILIVFREYVRITKYIHSHGVHHNDIKLENMMFRRSQGFIIDFNVSTKMYETKDKNMSAATVRKNAKRLARNDWQRFFVTMTYYAGVIFDLSSYGTNPKEDKRMIMKHLEIIEHPALNRVLVEFAKHAFYDDDDDDDGEHNSHDDKPEMIRTQSASETLFYDQLFQIINEEIAKFELSEPILVSWLEKNDLKKANTESKDMPDISLIKNCFEKVDAKYPEVHFDYFDQLNSASSSNEQNKMN